MGLHIKTNPAVQEVFDRYPPTVRKKMMALRELILETARETEGIIAVEETLKWGEPSYLTKNGSTLRMGWKPKLPEHYALYFKCTSRLVETFRALFRDTFQFERNRAILFPLKNRIPVEEVKKCIRAALTYHKVKHLLSLGI